MVLLSVFFVLLVACSQGTSSPIPLSSGQTTNITILHTNDIEGRLDNMPRLSTTIAQIREDSGTYNILLHIRTFDRRHS